MLKLLKWLLILVVVGLGGAWLYGRTLPREHVASSSIVLVATADTVWRVVRNIEGTPAWWSDMKGVRRVEGAARETWEEDMGSAGTLTIEVTSVVAGRQMVNTILNDEQEGWGGVWTYDVAVTAAGTEVTITEDGWIDSPIFRVVMKFSGRHRTMERYLRALGAHFGEPVTPRRG